MKTIKAIETRAYGCHFRSRLEARWATFFQEARIPWEYEPEGFGLRSGAYLPDFRIKPHPELEEAWFEVKPRSNDKIEARWLELAAGSGLVVMVARGMHRRDDVCGTHHTLLAIAPSGTVADCSGAWTRADGMQAAWDAASSARFENEGRGAAR